MYIHFSGHGTRQKPDERSYNTHTGDLALVVLGKSEGRPEAYLRGKSLAAWISDMVKAYLVVTVVLDCCFSATVYREGESNIRCIPYDYEIDQASPPDRESDDSETSRLPITQGASMLDNWNVDPDKHVTLLACGQSEIAKELKMADNSIHGALSFMLLQMLKEDDGLTNHVHDIYERLRSAFRKFRITQTPVLLGNKRQGFFGRPDINGLGTTLPAADKEDGTLEIQVGHAHRVQFSNSFTLHPCRSASDKTVSTATVISTTAFTSSIKLLENSNFYRLGTWRARALHRTALQRFPIRLDACLPLLDEWMAALKVRCLEVQSTNEEQPHFLRLTLNKGHDEYEIRKRDNEIIISLPVMPDSQVDIGQVGSVLEHLIKFQLAKSLRSETDPETFRSSLGVRLLYDGDTFAPGDLVSIKHDTRAQLHLENHRTRKVYMFIYDFGPSWQVKNIYKGTYFELAANITLTRKIRMKVPDSFQQQGRQSCKDTVKIIVTSLPTSFSFLELGKIGEPTKPGKAERIHRDGDENEEYWTTMGFYITTFLEPDESKIIVA